MRRNRFCAFSAFETKTVGLQCLCLRLYLIELSLLLNIHRASCHFSAKQTSASCQALFAWDGSEVSCLNSHTATNKIHHCNNNNNNRRLMFYINILCSIWTFFFKLKLIVQVSKCTGRMHTVVSSTDNVQSGNIYFYVWLDIMSLEGCCSFSVSVTL